MKIPVFSGEEDVYEWFNWIEWYFRKNGKPEVVWLSGVRRALRGEAWDWYFWWKLRTKEFTWSRFRVDVLQQFLEVEDAQPISSFKQTDLGCCMERKIQNKKEEEERSPTMVIDHSLKPSDLHLNNGEDPSSRRSHEKTKMQEWVATEWWQPRLGKELQMMGHITEARGQAQISCNSAQFSQINLGQDDPLPIILGIMGYPFRRQPQEAITSLIATLAPSLARKPQNLRAAGGNGSHGRKGGGQRFSHAEVHKKVQNDLFFSFDAGWNPHHQCKVRLFYLLIPEEEYNDNEERKHCHEGNRQNRRHAKERGTESGSNNTILSVVDAIQVLESNYGTTGEGKWESGGSCCDIDITWPLQFKQWDPGGLFSRLTFTLRTR